MNTLKKLYARFAALVIQFRNRLRTDPFLVARLQLMGVYLLIGGLIFMLYGWVFGSLLLKPLYEVSITQDGHPVDVAFATYRHASDQRRLIMATLFAVSAYFFTEFALLPVKRASELQKRFIATVSHELRTPLTIMKNTSEIALRNPATLNHDKAIQVIQSNLEETNRLSETLQFLLTFSLLRNQKRLPMFQKISLATVIEKILPLMKKVAAERDIKLEFISESESLLQGNSTALEALATNLIKNAISHSSQGSTVYVSIFETKSIIRLSVKDTGKGISKKDLPYIYEPFYRGSGEDINEETYKGFGLGLSIVKEIAEFHRARITIDTSENTGTTFIVSFQK